MFAALKIPSFALQCRLRYDSAGLQPAAALVEDVTKNSQVLEANKAARALSVTPVISSTQALSRAPKIRLFSSCGDTLNTANQQLRRLCLTFSPLCEETQSGLWIMDLSGTSRLNPRHLGRTILSEVKQLGMAARLSFAQSADLAELSVRSQSSQLQIIRDREQFLATCSPQHATEDRELLSVFKLWGIHNLRDFTRIPVEAVTDRFGQAGRELWERAMGRNRRLLKIEPEAPTFKETITLEYELHSLEPLMFILQRFVENLCRELTQARLLATSLHIELKLDRADAWRKSIQLPEPICLPETLFSVLEKSLETVQTDHAIIGASLQAEPIEPNQQQRQLFEASIKNPWRFADTIDRLAAIVGPENIGTPIKLDTHRPDRIGLAPLKHTIEHPNISTAPEPYGPPLRRFRPQASAKVSFREDVPTYLRSEEVSGRIIDTRGPFEVSGEWWDAQFWKQTDWDIQLETGALYRICQTKGRWFLEGVYG